MYEVFQSKKKNNRVKIDSFKSHVSLVLAVVKLLNKSELIDACIKYRHNDEDDDITYTKSALQKFDVTKLRKILIMLLKLYDKFNELVSDSPVVKNEDDIQTMDTSASVSNDSNISDVTIHHSQPSKISISDSSLSTNNENVISSYKRKFSNVYGWKNVSGDVNIPTHKKQKVLEGVGFYGLLWDDGKSEQFHSNEREELKNKIDSLRKENNNEVIFYMTSVESACRDVAHHHTNQHNKKLELTISDSESIGSGSDNTGTSIGSNNLSDNNDVELDVQSNDDAEM